MLTAFLIDHLDLEKWIMINRVPVWVAVACDGMTERNHDFAKQNAYKPLLLRY